MSKALPTMLAAAAIAIALVLPDAVLAYDGAAAAHRSSAGVDILMAYVDPGAAGFVIVTVLGFLSAIGYTARAYLGRLRRLVPGRRRRNESD